MSVVIDASALLAVLLGEPGGDAVIPHLRGSIMSSVNLSECCSRAPERGSSAAAVLRAIQRFEVRIVSFDFDQAVAAGRLRDITRHLGLSLGDRACLALAASRHLAVFTGDRRLACAEVGIDVQLIR